MTEIYEDQLLGYCFRPLGDQAATISEALSGDEAEVLQQTLASFLVTEVAQDHTSPLQISTVTVPVPSAIKSVLYQDSGVSGAQKIIAFGFSDAAVEIALPLLGIIITLFTGKGGFAALPQIGGILKTLWSKLIILKRPQDADAIDVLQALLRVRAHHVTSGHTEYPTSEEIGRESAMSSKLVRHAFGRLNSLALIEAVVWGGQAGDVGHANNRWRVKL